MANARTLASLLMLGYAPLASAFVLARTRPLCSMVPHRTACPMACTETKEQASPEEVAKKWGLEAGLFAALRSGGQDGREGSAVSAGDLLKRYGGAYLLTSTTLAAVSFTLCFVLVNNGIDVAALLGRFGIEASAQSETAGTVGIPLGR